MMAHLGRHAIVIGASMSGLLAGRALADYYDEVTLVDRDALCLSRTSLAKGFLREDIRMAFSLGDEKLLEQLFPGFTAEMVAEGAVSGDVADTVLWFNHGFLFAQRA